MTAAWRLLIMAVLMQLLWHLSQPSGSMAASAMGPAPSLPLLHAASLGEPVALSKWLMLKLQSEDDAATPLARLDYARLRDWLERISDLDPRAQYPMLAASQVYALGPDEKRIALMLDFVEQRFDQDPQRRWPWLAHAALVAKHRLHKLPLALRYARKLRTATAPASLPAYAGQMEIFILEDMNEYESAQALIGAMLASGQVHDARELAFLERRLERSAQRCARIAGSDCTLPKDTP